MSESIINNSIHWLTGRICRLCLIELMSPLWSYLSLVGFCLLVPTCLCVPPPLLQWNYPAPSLTPGLNHQLTAAVAEAKRTWALIWSRLARRLYRVMCVRACVCTSTHRCTLDAYTPPSRPFPLFALLLLTGARSMHHPEAETATDCGFMESLHSPCAGVTNGPTRPFERTSAAATTKP